ncbi:YadA-like family protein [Moraxella catarrhalis]|uniref:YadA-like family protein n=2 Tax=Moraxella catarrhalis TaxID=480 RepID=UPI000EA98741|nr:YadA-like family protein [Moraxella catarrhalis]MPX29150.1 cell surface protein [Moraxella catarrhalis]RKM00122.1 cell surface protein [Moraxella catarrhalis]
MKTMKLLPLKIAVTSAMIIGLGAASTANAQAQSNISISPLERVRGLIENTDFDKLQKDQKRFQNFMFLNQYANVVVMEELNKNVEENKRDLSAVTGKAFKNQIDIQKNNDSIEDLYEANNDNVERLVEHDRAIEILTEAGNHHDTLIRKNKADIKASNGKIESLKTLYETTVRTVGNNEKAIEEHRKLIADNKANIKTLAKAQLESATFFGEQIQENKDDISAVTGKAFKNQIDIQKNNDSIEDLYEANNDNVERLVEHDRAIEILAEAGNHHDDLIRKNKSDIQDLAANNELQTDEIENLIQASSANTDRIANAELGIAENKKDALIAKAQADKNKNDIQDLAKVQRAGVEVMAELNKNIAGTQTDIANNKITLAQHAKKIDDNQQAIEAKLGGKADLQKLSELKTSVDKNQADIQLHDQKINNLGILHSMVARAVGANKDRIDQNKADIAENKEDIQNNINNIYELAQQQDQHSSDIKTLAKASSANTDNIAKNKADADASFKTLTKNQNALIEKDKAQDTLIAANKADADASFKTLTKNQNALIEKDKAQDKLITANKADADAKFTGVQTDIANNKTTLAQHAKKINDNQQAIEAKLGGKADAQALNNLNDKVNGFDGRISALDTKVNAFDGRITALDSKVENGMAAQAALSGLFQPYSVGKFNATAALGGYGSKSAVAIGAGYRVNPNLAIKAGAAINTSGDKKGSYNIGVNYEF